jgi:hypothetical protein
MLTFSTVIETRRVSVMFNAKPEDRIRSMLKANGFRWSPAGGFWWRPRVSGFADFCAALDRAIHPHRPDGPCWRCQAPEGFFRPQGAATPVYCDDCWRALNAPPQIDRFDLDHEDHCREACGL